MEIRKITKAERSAVKILQKYAYGTWSDAEVTEGELANVVPEDTLGLFEDGELISTVMILPLKQSVRGVIKGMGGIADVGTYPESRYQGHMRALMEASLVHMKSKGLSVSMLMPFRDTFYARFGYVKANSHMLVKAPLRALQHTLKEKLEGDWKIERVHAIQAKDTFLPFMMEVAPLRHHGIAFFPDISEAEWKRRNKEQFAVIVRHQDRIEAAALYRIKGYMHFTTEGELTIREMYWRTLEARNKLFNFFTKHIDQVIYITMHVPFGINIHQWFSDPLKFIEVKMLFPWMVRVVDVVQAVNGLPAEEAEPIIIELSDPHCDWNNGIFMLQSEKGKLVIQQDTGTPTVRMTIKGLSALVYGTLSIEELEYKEWIKVREPHMKRTLNCWFPTIPIHNYFDY